MDAVVGDAQSALLLEVAGTPKPGNVDRRREYPDLRFEAFLLGAVGARRGLARAADPGLSLGEAFETAVAGMARRAGTNTQFGALLLLTPLVRAAADPDRSCTPAGASEVVEATTVADAAAFYRAFDHVEVAVGDPEGTDLPDVRRGSGAVPAVEERGLTLGAVMERSADRDGIAREYAGGFERTFGVADRIADADGPLADRAAAAYLDCLAAVPDSLVATVHGPATAREVAERADRAREAGPGAVEALAESLVEEGVNPGTTADVVAGGLFVALRRGVRAGEEADR